MKTNIIFIISSSFLLRMRQRNSKHSFCMQ